MRGVEGEKWPAKAVRAGFAYFAVVFAFGFAFGAFRTIVVAPTVGELTAVALEVPFMLALSWIASRWLIGRLGVDAGVSARLTMGGVAFALLMVAELGLSVLLGRTLTEHFGAYRHAPGILGLAGQVAFAAFPLVRWPTARPN